jgi:hypothetical protein
LKLDDLLPLIPPKQWAPLELPLPMKQPVTVAGIVNIPLLPTQQIII